MFPKWHGFFQSPGNMKASCVNITLLFKSFCTTSHFLELLGKSRLYFSFFYYRYSFFIWYLDKVVCLDWMRNCLFVCFFCTQSSRAKSHEGLKMWPLLQSSKCFIIKALGCTLWSNSYEVAKSRLKLQLISELHTWISNKVLRI